MLDASTELSNSEVLELNEYVLGGGGLLTAGQAWWWATNNSTPAAVDYPANAWLEQAGIVITSEPAWNGGVDDPLTTPAPVWLHHRYALAGMQAVWDGVLSWDLETQAAAVGSSRSDCRRYGQTLDTCSSLYHFEKSHSRRN